MRQEACDQVILPLLEAGSKEHTDSDGAEEGRTSALYFLGEDGNGGSREEELNRDSGVRRTQGQALALMVFSIWEAVTEVFNRQ